jgi:transcription elongation GreA/GreB family factor
LTFKKKIIQKLIEKLEVEMLTMVNAALVAREAATHEESKAEDKYDTRGLEASYLAGAQAKRASELARLIHTYQNFEISPPQKDGAIAQSALVEVELRSIRNLLFIAPKGGGIVVEVDGQSIQIVTPDSKLGSELLGKQAGDLVEVRIAERLNEYEILSVS